jgi:hypothetical protein
MRRSKENEEKGINREKQYVKKRMEKELKRKRIDVG